MKLTAMALMRAAIVSLLAVPMIGAAQLIRADHDRLITVAMDRYAHPSEVYLQRIARHPRSA